MNPPLAPQALPQLAPLKMSSAHVRLGERVFRERVRTFRVTPLTDGFIASVNQPSALPENLSAARAPAFAASTPRFRDCALVSTERSRRADISATSSTAAINEPSFAFDGLLKPLIFQ
jgi:hypothetical protein